ncbi:YopX family protein [Enterococcus casseliflavus]|uniref:YopX family protein n=1 Tax=Enterococcus casseliflavus TaxID=37734 RepID=UPI001CD37578|nr:YopX family protein [Enterococcus casseliflavus]
MVPKFRGKRKDNGEWVVGVPIPNSFCNVVHMIPILLTDKVAYPPERLYEYLIEIEPETLGQSTGLKDKNGVEISEGDIVAIKYSESGYHYYEKIVFENGTFTAGDEDWLYNIKDYCVVCGNIYENPELLEPANEN